MSSNCRIKIERSGGFAGIRLGGQVDRDDLSPVEATKLDQMLAAVDAAKFQDAANPSGQPDRFRYPLSVDCGALAYDIRVGESEMDPPLKALVDWLMHRVRS